MTPARAGRTSQFLGTLGTLRGSSPLARGGLSRMQSWGIPLGLIPARAGRTSADPRASLASRGSSPLARGGRPGRAAQDPRPGLIPARAGRTCEATVSGRVCGAHPRSRGADRRASVSKQALKGSSPLARGGLTIVPKLGLWPGLIPARAGRTRTSRSRRTPPRAHPRSRGADDGSSRAGSSLEGSSPLARGGP